MNAEMMKLRDYLDDDEILWYDRSEAPNFYRTEFHVADTKWLVTSGRAVTGCARALLELTCLFVNNGDPVGNFTSDEIIEMVRTYENNGMGKRTY